MRSAISIISPSTSSFFLSNNLCASSLRLSISPKRSISSSKHRSQFKILLFLCPCERSVGLFESSSLFSFAPSSEKATASVLMARVTTRAPTPSVSCSRSRTSQLFRVRSAACSSRGSSIGFKSFAASLPSPPSSKHQFLLAFPLVEWLLTSFIPIVHIFLTERYGELGFAVKRTSSLLNILCRCTVRFNVSFCHLYFF